jgi:hypothetical protein
MFLKKGDMIMALYDAEAKLSGLLKDPEVWQTLDVDYEPPRVERLWVQLGLFRLYLHRIHPCETPLFHAHPWPSAVRIISGRYEMDVGHDHLVYATITLAAGSEYEMIDKLGMHSVKPVAVPSLSVMITGEPWKWIGKDPTPHPPTTLNPLSPEAKGDLLNIFRQFYR